ncbi:putative histone-lysine N-methyltransferase 1 isoform X2 [Adelges cooleyi]|uniref:putative histone-lysine N-methyltransferase 1 isoform X2 n=1 Tax=Adelges cooleyi TaxID=133065 RepID=UPI00217F7D1D|nr:putative histone-lysine N-methyltransferase 1 isoform X2 [Adelges cooleyi]
MDTEWICTQAIAFDDQSTNDVVTVKNFGCIILNDKADDEKYILHEGDNTIGRHPLNSIYVEHPSVSMYHAVIQCDSDGIVLLDKGSLNKTKLNKKTLRKDVAYFLDEDSSLSFGEVQANYYVDVENSNINSKRFKNECGSKDCITENTNLSVCKTPNTATQLTKPIGDDKNYEFTNCQQQSLPNCEGGILSKAVLHNSGTSTIIEKSNLRNVLSNTNPSSPSDELLLNALSQVETNECETFDREDTPSPVLDLRDQLCDTSSLPAFNTTNCTEEELITALNNQNDRSKFDMPDKISREDTPSPVIDLGLVENSESELSTQYNDNKKNTTNLGCEETQLFELENDIFDCPTQMETTVESIRNEQKISTGLQVTKQIDCSTIESTSNLHSDETQIPNINDCSPHKNIESIEQREFSEQNVSNIQDEETQIVHFDNDGLFDCSQKKVIKSTFTNSSQNKHNEKENENIIKSDIAVKPNTSSFHEIETQIVSLDNDFFDCHTQKVISTKDSTANTSKTSVKDTKTTNKSNNLNTLNTSMFSEMDTQLAELDDDFFDCPTQKIISTKLASSDKESSKPLNTTSLIKSRPSALNEMDTQISEFNSPFVDSKSQNAINSKQPEFGLVLQSNKSINKENKTGNDNFFDCPTQKLFIPSANNIDTMPCTSVQTRDLAKGVGFKSELNLHEADTQNVEIINDYETKNNCNKYVNTFEADDDDIFNCLTQKVVKPSNDENVCVKKFNPNNISVTQSTLSEHCNKSEVIELENDDFFNCPTQKISHFKVGSVKAESTAQNNTNSNNYFEADDDDIFSGLNYKASTSKQIYENRTRNDVFKCLSQKFALKKSVDIHDAETQAISFEVKSQTPIAATSKHCSLADKDINQTIEMDDDDDFFNCPTQKLPSTKNTNLSHGMNLEHSSDISVTKKSNTDTISITNKKKQSFESNDDDFFNCHTQKVTCSKTAISMSSNIHLAETQSNYFHPIKPVKSSAVTFNQNIIVHNISGINSTALDDEDMFNCPTQKISTSVSTNSLKNVSAGIHEETQVVSESDQVNATSFSPRKLINEEETQVTNMCENDFFDCPTQKCLSNIENKFDRIPNKPKNNLVDTQEETQLLTEDDDIFNCPTQKISPICKNKSLPTNMSKIHEAETQQISSLDKLDSISKPKSNSFGDQISDEDDDFFVCPTQKITSKNRLEPTPSSLICKKSNIHELETQIASPIKLHKFSKPRTCNFNNKGNDEDDDFFNCATQKLSLNCKVKPTTSSTTNDNTNKIDVHESETRLSMSPLKSDNCTNINTSRDQISDEDDNFFNCPTQKISLNFQVKPTTINITKEITKTVDMHNAETQQLSSPTKLDNFSKPQNEDDDVFNCPTQKIIFKDNKTTVVDSKNINEDETQCFDFDNDNFTSNNLVNTVNILKTSKTSTQTGCSNVNKNYDLPTLKRNVSSIGVIQKDRIAKSEKCSLTGGSKTSSVPLIRIRNDLHAPGERNKILKLSNKPNKTVQNVSCTSDDIKLGTENSNSPRRSKRSIKGKLNHHGSIETTSIIKQEPIDFDLGESRVSNTSKTTPLLKQMDESIYSPFNIVNACNTIVDSTMKSKIVNNVSLPNSELSTPNDAEKWQSFWNKKKSKSQESQSSGVGQSTSKVINNDVVVVRKQRYQTRAVTKKENGCEDVNRKRKLDLPSEDSNKRICNIEKQCQIRILDKKPEHFIVTFSHLKSRHLQSMKEFVEKTGGFVTDEITQCTILVTDKIRCTMKILSAIARGCPIVTTSWIKHSYAVKVFQGIFKINYYVTKICFIPAHIYMWTIS